jgi:hypothetical protein
MTCVFFGHIGPICDTHAVLCAWGCLFCPRCMGLNDQIRRCPTPLTLSSCDVVPPRRASRHKGPDLARFRQTNHTNPLTQASYLARSGNGGRALVDAQGEDQPWNRTVARNENAVEWITIPLRARNAFESFAYSALGREGRSRQEVYYVPAVAERGSSGWSQFWPGQPPNATPVEEAKAAVADQKTHSICRFYATGSRIPVE